MKKTLLALSILACVMMTATACSDDLLDPTNTQAPISTNAPVTNEDGEIVTQAPVTNEDGDEVTQAPGNGENDPSLELGGADTDDRWGELNTPN